MKVLVTGATGFLGRHILRRLGEHEGLALTRRQVDIEAKAVRGDILDRDSLVAAMAGCDAVIHAAGEVSHHPADAGTMWKVHVTGTENAILAAKAAGVKRFVHLSSSGTVAVSRSLNAVATEETPTPTELLHQWPYYRAKLYSEQLALGAKDIEVVSLNPSLLLGPGDVRGGSTRPVRYFLSGRLPAVPAGGLSFVDVRDVATIAVDALTKGRPGHRYLLGTCNLTFHDFYSRIARMTGKAPPLKLPKVAGTLLSWIPDVTLPGFSDVEERIDVDMACCTWYLDDRKARAELGWAPRDPGETLAEVVEDIRYRAG